MKLLLVIVALIILAGAGYYFLRGAPASAPTDSTETSTATEHADDIDHAPESEDTTSEGGTDAGMEFPTIDTGITIDADAKVFNITGADMRFSTSEIRVKEGDTVTINFTSNGGYHDWVIDEFNAETERVEEGKTSSVTFVADRKGIFEYYCSVSDHREMGMVGKLVVE